MELNRTPKYDMSDNETGCCPRFNHEGWDEQLLHFRDKLFVKAKTLSFFHIPLNIGLVFPKMLKAIEDAQAVKMDEFIALSYDPSPWRGEHYFAVTEEIPGQEMVRLSGDYITRVFEGPYKKAHEWHKIMEEFVNSKGKKLEKMYFFYTTCPRCSKHYGKNYVVGVAEVK
ncbi:MAG: hydrolase [Planctomycetota bacterium]